MVLKLKEKITRKTKNQQKLVSIPVVLIEEFKKKNQILNNIVVKHKNLVKLTEE